MSAQLRIDQVGRPDGVPGRSRTDGLANGAPVTLTNTGSGSSTAFNLLWVPPGDTTAESSLAATGDPKVWTFTPTAEKYGTYMIEMVENAGLVTEVTERRVLVMRTPLLALIIPALNERGDHLASLVESRGDEFVDNNADDLGDAALDELTFAGWWRAMHLLITATERLADVPAARVTHYSGTARTTKSYDTLAAALAVNYPSSVPSSAVYDIAPNVHDVTPGPITLDTIVHYVLRSVAGPGSVMLPQMTLQSTVHIEGCVVANALAGGTLFLKEAQVSADVTSDYLSALDSSFDDDVALEMSGTVSFDRCRIGENVTITNTAGVGLVTLSNCTFGGAASVVFTGGSPGVVRMDSRTAFLFDEAGGAVTNGSITVEAPP